MSTKRTPTIWSHTIVCNEENFIWFALMSVVDHVDQMLVWDTGSTDSTVKIIKKVIKQNPGKISFKQVGPVDKFEFTKMRQAMLDETLADWFLVVDGDEVWWKKSIKKVTEVIQEKGGELDAIVVPFYNAVGDIYHYQPESAGEYQLLGRRGHLTIRAINRAITGLHLENPYGSEGYFDADNQPIQQGDPGRLVFLEAPFLHLTHLKRSSQPRQTKFKYELGISFPKDFNYPEVFYQQYPSFIKSPWQKMSAADKLLAASLTPLRQVKRTLEK